MPEQLDTLETQLTCWAAKKLNNLYPETQIKELVKMPGDASNRCYYRLRTQAHKTYVLAYSPEDKSSNIAFIAISQHWLAQGIRTPVVFAANLDQGFLLLEDLGSKTFLSGLHDDQSGSQLYKQSLSVLIRLQRMNTPETKALPCYQPSLLSQEINLFFNWFVVQLLEQPETSIPKLIVNPLTRKLINNAMEQPQVLTHRDFHSRNLMITASGLGVLDFQDAIWGPITYDIVSILRDCYISLSDQETYEQLDYFIKHTPVLNSIPTAMIYRWFDWMGCQRHLKAIGIFSRQWIQKNNPSYLSDIPRVLHYILEVCQRYEELKPFGSWLNTTILPKMLTHPQMATYFKAKS